MAGARWRSISCDHQTNRTTKNQDRDERGTKARLAVSPTGRLHGASRAAEYPLIRRVRAMCATHINRNRSVIQFSCASQITAAKIGAKYPLLVSLTGARIILYHDDAIG